MLKDLVIKSIFWLLLITNLMWGIAIAYQKWGGRTSIDASASSWREEQLEIIDNKVLAGRTLTEKQDIACLKMSPLTAEQSLMMLTALESSHAKRFARDGSIWWIQWRSKDEREARIKLQEYQEKKVDEFKVEKIKDSWLLRAGPFSNESQAVERLAQMNEKGIKFANLAKESSPNTFEVRFGPWASKDMQELRNVTEKLSQAKMVECESSEKMEWWAAK
jgi:hypothetical protein